MAYTFTCDLCHRTVQDGADRVITAAGAYSATGEPAAPVGDLPPGGPEIEGMIAVAANRALYHPDCWAAMLAAEPPAAEEHQT